MKKLGKLTLSDAKVMGFQEMKMITGGQQAYNSCKNTGTGSGIGSSDDVVCSGECPTEGVTGNTPKQKCVMKRGLGSTYLCLCE